MSKANSGGAVVDAVVPKVFVSYSWTNEAHVEWVKQLAIRLQSDGVHVVLDRWDLQKGHDKYVFMERMVNDPTVTKVLAICDAKYAEKADGRQGGVGTESQIISKEVYDAAQQEKFIALVREWNSDGSPCLPTFFKNRIYIDFTDDTKYEERLEELHRDVFGAPAEKRPPLGTAPAYLFARGSAHVKTAPHFLRLKNAVDNARPNASALFDDYLDGFLEALEDFRIVDTRDDKSPFDELVVRSITDFQPYRDNFVECVTYMLRHGSQAATEESLAVFIERLIPFQSRPEDCNRWAGSDFDNYRFMCYELCLYIIAACIRTRRYSVAAALIECEYHVTKSLRGSEFCAVGLDACNQHVGSLDGDRNKRLSLNLISVTAAIVKERSPSNAIAFSEVMQADFLLYVRSFFPSKGGFGGWFPRCLPYAERSGAMELFSRAAGDRGLETLKTLLHVPNREALMDGLDQVLADVHTWGVRGFHVRYSIPRLLNIEGLNAVSGRQVKTR